MEVSQGNLARLLIGSFLCGFTLACLGDIIRQCIAAVALPITPAHLSPRALRLYNGLLPAWRIERKRCPSRSTAARIIRATAQFLYDVFFTVGAAIVLLLLFYAMNDGQFRPGAVLIMLLGLAVYHITLKKGIGRIFPLVTVAVQALMFWVGAICAWPVRRVWKWTLRPRRWIKGRIVCLKEYVKRRIRQRREKHASDREDKQESAKEPDRISTLREQHGGKNIYVAGRGNR